MTANGARHDGERRRIANRESGTAAEKEQLGIRELNALTTDR